MLTRVVGAHNIESNQTRHTCFLIDGVLAIDAGSLVGALTPQEHRQVAAVLVTHAHLDHCRDIPTLGLSTLGAPHTIHIYALAQTLESIQAHLMDGSIYPDMTKGLNSDPPRFLFHAVQLGQPFEVMGYKVEAAPATHPVPAAGYIVQSEDGTAIGCTGDTMGDLLPFLQRSTPLQALFVDVTFPNHMEPRAAASGHLTPARLGSQLGKALEMGLRLPRIIPVHLDVHHWGEVAKELACEGRRLGVNLVPAHQDMTVV
ncbi:MAG: hypothetical protein HY532_04435 [Chloroflexi bacterium]|nr:hypothetical protein [Chloroflexota bacterium]